MKDAEAKQDPALLCNFKGSVQCDPPNSVRSPMAATDLRCAGTGLTRLSSPLAHLQDLKRFGGNINFTPGGSRTISPPCVAHAFALSERVLAMNDGTSSGCAH